MKFRKKPVLIDAVRFTGENFDEVFDWADMQSSDAPPMQGQGNELCIDTLEGEMIAKPGDWIICGIQCEFYPCRPDIFEATYEAVP